ncbi:hypothetical protein [Mucilaginibacter aquaedulcis]|uniref:hypothetical protein n=1 Tax=Mucilaginibacter aquaedulcis TaxID=1187081 RepID=UPI0025B61CE2|nr:hypothetical protein [Mucilaginibacter aquaedulcis]MDN3547080.1 hypothetical protein [Mucilaginibacter aquaedulcis]
MKYIFFCIYNTQYLDGNNKVNKTPWFDAVGLMITGSFLWISIIDEIIYFYLLNQNIPDTLLTVDIVICVFLFWTHYFVFIKDKNYDEIYKKYKSINASKNRKTEKLVAISYIFTPAIINMLIALKWHKII